MVFIIIGFFVFLFFSSKISFVLIVVNFFLMGIGFGFFLLLNINVVMSCVLKLFYGMVLLIIFVMRVVG